MAPPFQLTLACDRTRYRNVFFSVDHPDRPAPSCVNGAASIVVSLFSRSEILCVADVERVVSAAKDVSEGHSTTMPSSSLVLQDERRSFDAPTSTRRAYSGHSIAVVACHESPSMRQRQAFGMPSAYSGHSICVRWPAMREPSACRRQAEGESNGTGTGIRTPVPRLRTLCPNP